MSSFFVFFSTSFFYLTRFFRRNNHLEVKKKNGVAATSLVVCVKKLKHRSKDPGISHPLPVATGIISFTRFLGCLVGLRGRLARCLMNDVVLIFF